LGQRIKVWRFGLDIAITAEPVGTGRVKGDEQDVEPAIPHDFALSERWNKDQQKGDADGSECDN
jgi:hypothetical protein